MKDAILKSLRICLFLVCILAPSSLLAQGVVSGTVLDGQNEPVIGATVVEKGNPKNGTVTDLDGKFSLTLKQGKQATITYVGMQAQDIKVGDNQTIVLKENNDQLDEVVVLGYTSKARRDLTGSVGSVSGAKLAAVPVTSAAVALQGKISGVQVTTVDGQPGADVNIRVRGGTSITQSNEPLYIVDGFEVSNINDIPPTDIASIDVLKDASLTAVYGAKGGNGVVVVTTKSAQAGKVQVSFNGNLSWSHLSKKLDLMNAEQFAVYQYQRFAMGRSRSLKGWYKSNFGSPYDFDMYSTLPSHDWQDEVMGETPMNYSANVNVGGGSDKVKFNVSLTNSQDKGIILGSGVRRTNINTKLNAQLTKNLSLQFNPKFVFRRDEGAGGNNIGTGGIIDVLRYRPTNGLRDFGYVDPAYADPLTEEVFTYTNPKNDIAINQLIKHTYTYTNAVALDWKPIKGLTLRTDATVGLQWTDQSRFYGSMTSTGKSNNNQPVAQITNQHKLSYVWTNTANYAFSLDDHNLSFLLGQEIKHSQTRQNYMYNRYFPTDFTAQEAWDNMSFGTPYQTTSSLSTADRMASFFGQANWNYDHRYFLSATFRADGSTKFAPGNQWGYFPAISGAWDMKKEPWLKKVDWIDQLKIRLSYGLTGNNNISNDLWRDLYAINSTGGPGFAESTQYGEQYYGNNGGTQFRNRDIKWEKTIKRNLGIDWSLWGGRLTISPEVYWYTTKDLLYKSDLPSVVGYTTQMQNIGQVTNRGVELSITGDILRGEDYVLSANFNLGHNKMKIDKLNGSDNVIWDQNDRWKSAYNDYCLRVGDEVGLIYGFVYDGLYQMDEFYFDSQNNYRALPWGSSAADNGYRNIQPRADGYVTVINDVSGSSNSGNATLPGKIKFKDLDGDGRITENDRTVIGNTTPKVQGGFGLSGQWKDFDFSANFTFMLDFDLNNATAYALSSSTSSKNSFFNVLSKFSNGWQYSDIDGSLTGTPGNELYMLYWLGSDGVDIYRKANAGRTLWNPADVQTNLTQSYFIEDGSFLRCNDITIGYTLPKSITKKVGISKARFYVSASNLFVITGYSGYDPEVDIQTGLTCGMDYNRYPRARSFVFGTNITF